MKKETKVLCPQCGTEFAIADREVTTVATVIGKDSGLGPVYLAVAGQDTSAKQTKLPKTAQERIEALRRAGVDVSGLFAMQGANGGEHVVSNKGGNLSILDDNDPIFRFIIKQGTVPNRRLYRRFVMAQMFRMLSHVPYGEREPAGVTKMIHHLGYDYQWKMLLNELQAQMKMEGRDAANFADRNRWFNARVVKSMVEDYYVKLKKHIDGLPVKRCKGIPYKVIEGIDIYVKDLSEKIFNPLGWAIIHIDQAQNATQLYNAVKQFNNIRIKRSFNPPQCNAWVDAYKGSGAFFTMQNLIRFHGCVAFDDNGKRLDKYLSLAFLSAKAELYSQGEGWRLLAMLKKMLDDNGINIKKKMAEWQSRK